VSFTWENVSAFGLLQMGRWGVATILCCCAKRVFLLFAIRL